jgi:hypothetical protein
MEAPHGFYVSWIRFAVVFNCCSYNAALVALENPLLRFVSG